MSQPPPPPPPQPPPPHGKGAPDIESGATYPAMAESSELRWAFIRKVYSILTLQLLVTIAASAVGVKVKPISHFFVSSGAAGIGLLVFLLILPIILLFPLYLYHKKHPVNLLLIGLFTLSVSFAVGAMCAFTKGEVILESSILTAAVVVSLTLYTFWAARRGHDFNFLGPFLFAALMILIVSTLIQFLVPMGKLSHMIYAALGAIIFSGYVIYDTDNLIKRCSYDEYIWARWRYILISSISSLISWVWLKRWNAR